MAPSGRQWELEGAGYRAVVVEVGGGLRTLHHDGHALLDGYEADALAEGGRGQLLLPWPNRVADGRYRFAGREPPARPERAGARPRHPRPGPLGVVDG